MKGAIIAQIAVTALSLPALSQAHWIARALFVVSLVTGLLSVYFAVLLQRTIGALYQVMDIRNWLSSLKDLPLPKDLKSSLRKLKAMRKEYKKNNEIPATVEE